MAEDLWRIEDGGEREPGAAGEERSVWLLTSWSGGRQREVEVTWPSGGVQGPEGSGVAEALAGPPGRRGLSAVLGYLAAENPPARVRLTEEGLLTEPRWITIGAPEPLDSSQGRGWSWLLQGPAGRVRVEVVEDPALTGGRGLPKAVRDARSSKGRSALSPLLGRPRLPGRIRLDGDGVHLEASGDPGPDA